MSHKDNVVVVVAHAEKYYSDLILDSFDSPEIQSPIIFQLDDLYNINNIIISEIIVLSEETYLEEKCKDDEYINNKNDPYTVEQIIENDTLILEEKVMGPDKIVYSINCGRSEESLLEHDRIMEQKVLKSLLEGNLKLVF